MKVNTVKFTALLSVDDDAKLRAICAHNNESKGSALRRAVRSLYLHEVLGQPTCANGQRCYVPHWHQGQMPLATDQPPTKPTN